MKYAILFSGRPLCFLALFLLLISCSKEEINEDNTSSEVQVLETEKFTATETAVGESCVGSHPTFGPLVRDSVIVGNGRQYKELSTRVGNNNTHLIVSARYDFSLDNPDFGATISIDIDGVVEKFTDVKPRESVSIEIELDDSWTGGETIPIHVRQVGFLAPVEIFYDYYLVPPCPVEVGDRRFGGIVGYIFQEGDEGYVEGETHGIVMGAYPQGRHTWERALYLATIFDDDYYGYTDWFLPSADELVKLYHNDVLYPVGPFWSSTEVSEYVALGVAGREDVVWAYGKNQALQVLSIRYF